MTTGLTWLYHQCLDRFTAESIRIDMPFGRREVDKRIQGDAPNDYRRAVWSYGDDTKAGAWGVARYPGRTPRSLGTIEELFTITVSAYDSAHPDDEEAQYEAVREVERQVLRAIALATPSNYEIVDRRWLLNQKLRSKGAALQVVGTIQSTVADNDTTSGIETFAVRANIAATMQDQADQVKVTACAAVLNTVNPLSGLQGFRVSQNILVNGQADATENGIWEVRESSWVRSPIALMSGLIVEVLGGSRYELTTADPIVPGTSEITFVEVE